MSGSIAVVALPPHSAPLSGLSQFIPCHPGKPGSIDSGLWNGPRLSPGDSENSNFSVHPLWLCASVVQGPHTPIEDSRAVARACDRR